MNRWTVLTPKNDAVEEGGIPMLLTNREKSDVARYKCALEDNRRRSNEQDSERDRLIREAEQARMGIVWTGEQA